MWWLYLSHFTFTDALYKTQVSRAVIKHLRKQYMAHHHVSHTNPTTHTDICDQPWPALPADWPLACLSQQTGINELMHLFILAGCTKWFTDTRHKALGMWRGEDAVLLINKTLINSENIYIFWTPNVHSHTTNIWDKMGSISQLGPKCQR